MRTDQIEEYEMVNVSPNTNSMNNSITTSSEQETEQESDTESVSSMVFEQLELGSGNDKDNDRETFHDDTIFQSAMAEYMGIKSSGRRRCYMISIGGFLVWLTLLLLYSNMSIQDVRSNITWQTTIELGGENVSLNPYSVSNHNLTMDYIRNGQISPMFMDIKWLSKDQAPANSKKPTGHYLERGEGGIFLLKQHGTKKSETFISNIQFGYKNNFFYLDKLILNPKHAIDDPNVYHIIRTDVLTQWRHSSFGLYWLYKPSTDEYIPIQPKSDPDDPAKLIKLHFAEFSPDGKKVLFAVDHDLYIQDVNDMKVSRITSNGSPDIFNGKPDWVYEEEILSSDRMVWWNPNSDSFIYGSINDTGVNEYDITYYVKDANDIGLSYQDVEATETDGVNQYPVKKTIKYPKPGTRTPRLQLFSYNLKDKKSDSVDVKAKWDDFILYDGDWIDGDNFMIKITNSTSSVQAKKVISKGQVNDIEIVDASSFGGWFDKYSSIARANKGYVDKVVYNNRTHLAYYLDPLSKSPKILTTSKDWDVLDSAPVVYDPIEKVVYTLSNTKGPMDSHLIAVDLEGKIQFVLADEEEAHFSFKSDPDGQFLTLEYSGPGLPWQKIVDTGDLHVQENVNDYLLKVPMLSDYKHSQEQAQKVNIPTRIHKSVKIGKVEVSVMEILPPNFTPEKRKYPLLVNAYGGPGSQSVTKAYNFGFEDVVAAQLDAIVLVIDPRGTNGRGWNYKKFGAKNIGYWEPRDVTTITSDYIKKNKKIINKDAVAVWGWSYGGFTTLKTLEFDKGKTFKFGMAVAPVTNFLFYNSFYTERYMGSPATNKKYQTQSVINDTTAFKNLERFLIMHGTADDNVHVQNSMWLLDKFNGEGTENYDVQFFTDNDHGITYHNSEVIVFDKLLHWLQDAFMGKFKNFV